METKTLTIQVSESVFFDGTSEEVIELTVHHDMVWSLPIKPASVGLIHSIDVNFGDASHFASFNKFAFNLTIDGSKLTDAFIGLNVTPEFGENLKSILKSDHASDEKTVDSSA